MKKILNTNTKLLPPHIALQSSIELNKRSSQFHARKHHRPILLLRLPWKRIPKPQRLVTCPRHYRLSRRIHGEEEDATGVPRECGCFLQGGILPYDYFVVGVAVRADYLAGVAGEHDVTDLRTRVYAVQHCTVQRVPEFYGLVSRTAPRGQYSVIVWAPRYAFHRGAVR